MTIAQFHTYQEQTFDSFCKAVIRNESIDAFRELAHRREHEVEFSALPPGELASLQAEDPYGSYKRLFVCMGISWRCATDLWVKFWTTSHRRNGTLCCCPISLTIPIMK